MSLLPDAPAPAFVMSTNGRRIATYDLPPTPGEAAADAPVVVLVHGFASTAFGNWVATGWVRDLQRAGYRILAIDQRGHGASDKPHIPGAYTMPLFVDDLTTVLDDYLIDEAFLVGYSLGGRVGWAAAVAQPHRFPKVVLGGVPDGTPLKRFDVEQAIAHVRSGAEITDRLTQAYVTMAAQAGDNDLEALIALVEGMRDGENPDPAHAPTMPILFATGTEDPILEQSRALAAACPQGSFAEIPGRNHFNAPTSRDFRAAALAFLAG